VTARLIAWPFHNGLPGVGVGAGPGRLLEGRSVDGDAIRPVDPALPEAARIIELDRRLASRVRLAVDEGAFPVVLAGNCVSCLGTVAGAGAENVGVVWLDAHADFDTPDDTQSAFFDVMALSILTGAAWRAQRESIPGFQAVPEERVVLGAVRDLAPYQRDRLEASGVRAVPVERWDAGLPGALDELRERAEAVYLHVDVDSLDPGEGIANQWAASGGLTVEQVLSAIAAVRERFEVRAAAITAYDPAYDGDGRMAASAGRILDALIAAGVGAP
jgi:arginase